MNEYNNIDRRLIIAENRLQSHSEQLTGLHKITNDQGATLAKISKTLDRILWIAMGGVLFYCASTFGLAETLKRIL